MVNRSLAALALFLLPNLACDNGTGPSPEVVAALSVSPVEGTVLTDFEFDAGASVSSETGSTGLQYRWDWDGDGSWDTGWSGESSAERRFDGIANPSVTVEVREGQLTATATVSPSVNLNHGAVIGFVTLDQSVEPSGLAHDGEHFWISQWGPGETLVQVSSATGGILQSFPAHGPWTGSLTWDGTHLWQQSWSMSGGYQALIQINPASGAALGDIETIYSKFHGGLCWDGEGFFFGSRMNPTTGGDNRIHKYDKAGTELLVFDIPAGTVEPLGLACDGEALWMVGTESDLVYVMDPISGAVQRSFPLPGKSFIEIVDGYLWAFADPGDTRILRKIVP